MRARARTLPLVAGFVAVAAVGIWLWIRLLTEVIAPPQVAGHHDFFAFYAAAGMVAHHASAAVYDAAAMTAAERAILNAPVGAAGYMPYLNPPFAAAAQSGLATTEEPTARIAWLVVSVGVAILAGMLALRRWGWGTAAAGTVLVLLSFPAYQNLVEGQWSFVILLGLVASIGMATGRAGALAAVLWLKPPLALMLAVWSALTRRWRMLAGMILALGAVILLFLPLTGLTVYVRYLGFLWQVSLSHVTGAGATGATTWEGGLGQMEGLNGLVAGYLGQAHPLLDDVVTLVLDFGLVVGIVCLLGWERIQRPDPRSAASLVIAALLLDPHLYAQDLVLMLVLIPLLAPVFRHPLQAVLGMVLLLDLAALDTEWSSSWPVPFPPHLMTLALIVWAIALGRGSRVQREHHLAELASG